MREEGGLEDFYTGSDSSNNDDSKTSSSGPEMEQFENFGDYLTAIVDHAKSGSMGGESSEAKYEPASQIPSSSPSVTNDEPTRGTSDGRAEAF